MVKIRLKRMGKKKKAFYRIVIADARAPRDGKFIEEVGYFNPHSKDLKLNKESILSWLQKGAQPTETVRSLLKKEKIMAKFAEIKLAQKMKLAKTKPAKKPVVKKQTTK